MVNHIWLEECFRDWIIYSVADRRFNHFPGGPILRGLVGKTELIPETLSLWWKDEDLYPEEINRLPAKEYAKSIDLPIEKRDAFTGKRAAATKAKELVSESAEDMNAYAKEKRRKTAQSSSDSISATTATITEEDESQGNDDDATVASKNTVDQERDHTEGGVEEIEQPTTRPAVGGRKGRHKRDYVNKESEEEEGDHEESSNKKVSRGRKRQKNTDSTDESDDDETSTKQTQKKNGSKGTTSPSRTPSPTASRGTRKQQSTKSVTNESTTSNEKPVLLFTGFTDKLTKEKRVS